jgi:hypothetical protein
MTIEKETKNAYAANIMITIPIYIFIFSKLQSEYEMRALSINKADTSATGI